MLSLVVRLWNIVMEFLMGCIRNRGRSEFCIELSRVKVGVLGFIRRVFRFSWVCCLVRSFFLGVGVVSFARRGIC